MVICLLISEHCLFQSGMHPFHGFPVNLVTSLPLPQLKNRLFQLPRQSGPLVDLSHGRLYKGGQCQAASCPAVLYNMAKPKRVRNSTDNEELTPKAPAGAPSNDIIKPKQKALSKRKKKEITLTVTEFDSSKVRDNLSGECCLFIGCSKSQ